MKRIKLLLLILVLQLAVSAAGNCAEYYAGEFMNLGVGERALGMGGAFVGIADDATAIYWNPAGMGQLTKGELSLMYSEIFDKIVNYNCVSYVQPLGAFSIGLGCIMTGVQDVPGTEGLTETGGQVIYDEGLITSNAYNSSAYLMGFSVGLGSRMFLGATAKMLSESVFGHTASGFGVDVGFVMRTGVSIAGKSRGIRLGVNVQDAIGTGIAWDTGTTDTVPMSIKAGAGITVGSGLTIAASVDTRYGMDMSFGTEIVLGKIMALRAGVKDIANTSGDLTNNLTLGAGLGSRDSFALDYALVKDANLGDTMRVSLSMRFGKGKTPALTKKDLYSGESAYFDAMSQYLRKRK